ncbi:hypothetical protein OEA41_007727 [Lepraria neglecta]|uniref:Uncharacterized protein n=1 Tax=Lepraria neglecta TaxID=209136 RepID=A0AAD9ZG16_9LECA|nr:hypothetical protein OEA41_007727 [Lepraria neglecta]
MVRLISDIANLFESLASEVAALGDAANKLLAGEIEASTAMVPSRSELREVLNSYDDEVVKTMYEDVEAVKRTTVERLEAAKGTTPVLGDVEQMGSHDSLRQPQGRDNIEAQKTMRDEEIMISSGQRVHLWEES